MYSVVLDACVLFPNVLRDTVLTLAEAELFRPLWSEAILDEVRRNVIAKRKVDPALFDRTLALMNASFDGAMVDDWQRLVEGLDLPDPDDRHVLAAAIAGGAQAVVTFNLADFPAKQSLTTSTRFTPTRSCSTNWTSHQPECSTRSLGRLVDSANQRWISADSSPDSNAVTYLSSPKKSGASRYNRSSS